MFECFVKMNLYTHVPSHMYVNVCASQLYDQMCLMLIQFDLNHLSITGQHVLRLSTKHKYFKHIANVMSNFTNICYSLALQHQLHQCYLSLNSDTLLGEDLEVGRGTYVTVHHIQVCTCMKHAMCIVLHM